MISGERMWGLNDTPRDIGVALLRDQPSSEHVVSSTHCHVDASVFAFSYGLLDTFSERVLNSSNANQCEVICQIIVINLPTASQWSEF